VVAPRFSLPGAQAKGAGVIESAEIRERFIKFFEEKGHTRMPSWPLILKDDPSVLFTSAGMQPLVPYFLGKKQPPAKRIVAVQKVFRATDIDEVGRDGYHQTFFEMLGNFGIGDYWKKEAIEWGWELLTKVFGFDGDKLVATVHTSDDEAYEIWTKTLAFLSTNASRARTAAAGSRSGTSSSSRTTERRTAPSCRSRSGTSTPARDSSA
jgi:alanyl-tRNA synthetase